MAAGDIRVLKRDYGVELFGAEDRTTSSVTTNLLVGEPVKLGGTGTNFVTPLATGDPENGTDMFIGIVSEQSTETSTADGFVKVKVCGPGTVIHGRATTAANMNTAALLLGIRHDFVSMDVTGAGTNGPTGVFTIDEDEGTDPNVHGFMIITGDIEKGTLECFTALSLFYGNGI